MLVRVYIYYSHEYTCYPHMCEQMFTWYLPFKSVKICNLTQKTLKSGGKINLNDLKTV